VRWCRAPPTVKRDASSWAGGITAAVTGGLAMTGGLLAVMLSSERGCEHTAFGAWGGECKPGTQWTRTDEGLRSAGVSLLIGGAFVVRFRGSPDLEHQLDIDAAVFAPALFVLARRVHLAA
jgi:hypothetical protein